MEINQEREEHELKQKIKQTTFFCQRDGPSAYTDKLSLSLSLTCVEVSQLFTLRHFTPFIFFLHCSVYHPPPAFPNPLLLFHCHPTVLLSFCLAIIADLVHHA